MSLPVLARWLFLLASYSFVWFYLSRGRFARQNSFARSLFKNGDDWPQQCSVAGLFCRNMGVPPGLLRLFAGYRLTNCPPPRCRPSQGRPSPSPVTLALEFCDIRALPSGSRASFFILFLRRSRFCNNRSRAFSLFTQTARGGSVLFFDVGQFGARRDLLPHFVPFSNAQYVTRTFTEYVIRRALRLCTVDWSLRRANRCCFSRRSKSVRSV